MARSSGSEKEASRSSAARPEARLRVAYQGVEGAFSHMACGLLCPRHAPLACRTFDEALRVVEEGGAELALIPIENNLGGRVAEIHQLLSETSLFIVGEGFMPIEHHLLGMEGSRLQDIRCIVSHPQALLQCRRLLSSLGVETEARLDTAGSAREVASRGDRGVAALASRLAAETYGLRVLRERVEDKIGNTTRFITMSREEARLESSEACLTSLLFRTRNIPAALYKALGGFATNGVNLIRLESYVQYDSSAAEFYVEIEGVQRDASVRRALEELQMFSERVRLLGSYKAAERER